MANRINFYLGQLVTESDLDSIQTNFEASQRQLISDNSYAGVVTGMGVTQVGAGLTMSVNVAVGAAYDALGRRIGLSVAETVNVAVDENAVSTTVVGAGNERYVSIFLEYDETTSNPQLDNNGTTVFVDIAESYTIRVIQGAEAVAGTAVRPSLLPDAILVADILLANGTTGVTTAMIESDDPASTTSRFQWAFSATASSPTQVRARTLTDFADGMVDALNGHINSAGTAHPLSAVSFDNTSVPARYLNVAAATDGQAAFDAALTDLPNEVASFTSTATSPNGDYAVGQSGVVQGLVTTAPGGGTTVSISPGLAIKWGAVGVSSPFSIATPQVLDLSGDFAGSDVWACVELDTTTGTIVSTAGAAAANPVFPAGVASRIPLAYVYLDAGLGTIAATDVVLCRPMLNRPTSFGGFWEFKQGKGGIDVSALGSVVETQPMVAVSPDGLAVSTPAFAAFDLTDANLWESGESFGALALTNDVIHLYAALPVYPAGYDADVEELPREMITTGTRIPGAMHNCVLFASEATAPASSPSGDPGTTNSNNALWGAFDSLLYLGSVAHRAVGSVIRTQSVTDIGVAFLDSFNDRSTNVLATITSTLDFTTTGVVGGAGDQLLPASANAVLMGVWYTVDAATVGSLSITSPNTGEPLFFYGVLIGSDVAEVSGQSWIPGTGADFTFTDGGNHSFRAWCAAYKDAILELRE